MGAYIIKKQTARKILEKVHIENGIFDFSREDYFYVADHFIYDVVDNVYTIPLIGLNTTDTTIITDCLESKMKYHVNSTDFLMKSW